MFEKEDEETKTVQGSFQNEKKENKKEQRKKNQERRQQKRHEMPRIK